MKSAYLDNVREAKLLTEDERILAESLVRQKSLDIAKSFAPELLDEATQDNLESLTQIMVDSTRKDSVLLEIGQRFVVRVRFDADNEREKSLAVRYIVEEIKEAFAEEMLARYMAHFKVSREQAQKDFDDDMERLYFQDGVTSELELGTNLFKAILPK